ncbi:substrate-binding domain-containing protein [Cohnella sp. LGH]|uniref:GntR family transcriptional regulator n=1 Tax=Cohnella sp. LGH TaxID=1619153 RepID=UPI001ADACC83|nr:substrate-binding domain-containing protein [Cohnella sp. LGH]QTH40352.1 substrate-binding domain-containing protein [Cohnella sp. LGH]
MGEKEKKAPLYIQIREYIKNQIESGVLKPGDQIPTETDLTNKFQVSRITIKSALRHLVDEGLIYRVAGKGSFVSSEESHGLPQEEESVYTPKTKIGFLMPQLGDMLSIQLLRGIEEVCREEGLVLMVKSVLTQLEERLAIREMIAEGAEGLIIFPVDGEAYSEEILKLKSEQFPFVLVDRYLPGIKTNAVFSDNQQGGFVGTDYLAQRGHKNIGIVSFTKSKTSSSEDRFSGYLGAAKQNRLPLQHRYWLTQFDDVSFQDEQSINDEVFDWLQQEPDITAIFAFSPQIAICAARAAERLGRKIPEELSIICFDNPQIRDMHGDYFTWIEQNIEWMGTEAVNLLLRVIRDPSVLEQLVIPVSLREGLTVSAPNR